MCFNGLFNALFLPIQEVVYCTAVTTHPDSSFFSFVLCLSPGQIQEVSLSQEETAPQVEVTPDLDLEVVPESSGDWPNVFSWSQTEQTPEIDKKIGQSTEYSLTFTSERQSLTKHCPPLMRVIKLGTVTEDVINRGFLPQQQPPAVCPD